ncbi:MAG: radical SAM protein [Bdellovibrio sp.]
MNLSEIKVLHVELTNKCNAGCPMCARSWQGRVFTAPLKELQLHDFQDSTKNFNFKNLNRVYFCGNFGDPIMAQDCLAIVEYLRKKYPHLSIGIHTNGGARSSQFWQDLAPLLTYCRFGIDGLEDTNHLYRRGVNWKILMKNVKTFIDAGGIAEWDFLVFKHNEHQVEAAREFAATLGFRFFQTKSSSRYVCSIEGKPLPMPVVGAEGQKLYDILWSDKVEYRNTHIEKPRKAILNQEISCKALNEKTVYLNADGRIYPCCWLAEKHQSTISEYEHQQVTNFFSEFEFHKSNENHFLEQSFSKLRKSWSLPKNSLSSLQVCTRVCGTESSSFRSQFLTSKALN